MEIMMIEAGFDFVGISIENIKIIIRLHSLCMSNTSWGGGVMSLVPACACISKKYRGFVTYLVWG